MVAIINISELQSNGRCDFSVGEILIIKKRKAKLLGKIVDGIGIFQFSY